MRPVTLNEIRNLAEEMFPGVLLSAAHLLKAWVAKDREGELKQMLSGAGIDINSFAESLVPFVSDPSPADKELLTSCIQSVPGEAQGLHLMKRLCESPSHRLTISFAARGMDCTRVLENIRKMQDGITCLSRFGIQVNGSAIPLLKFGRELTALARDGAFDELTPIPEETNRLFDVLLRKRKGNPVLTGPAGVGKTTAVELLALDIARDSSSPLAGYGIYEIYLGKMLAGTKYRGEFEERFDEVMQAMQTAAPAILFIDEIHLLVGSGRAEGAAMDGANMMKPFLARDDFRVIGATTSDEFHRYIARDEALARRFQELKMREPGPEQLLSIVLRHAQALATHHRVEIDEQTVQNAIELTNRYVVNRYQPDKSIDILDSAAVAVRRQRGTKLGPFDLLETLSRLAGIPIGTLTQDERALLRNLSETLKTRVVGQDEAIEKVVRALVYRRMDLGRADRPLGVFLFAGGTGVGKTQLARSVAVHLFGDEKRCIHINLAEYSGQGAENKLIGPPSGYVGSDEDGVLIKALQQYPSSVVLFDEVEKATGKIRESLLGLLEEGRISSGKGESIDARQCIIIMTTNAVSPSDLQKQPVGFGQRTEGRPDAVEMLAETFPPEFLGRADEIILFRALSKDDLRNIMKLRLDEALENLRRKSVRIVFEEVRLLDYLMKGFDGERSGARGIARALERNLLQPLAMKLLDSEERKETAITLGDDFYEKGTFAAR